MKNHSENIMINTEKMNNILNNNTFRIVFQCDNYYIAFDLFAFLLTKERKIKGDDYLVCYASKCRCNDECSQLIQCESDWIRSDLRPCDPEVSICFQPEVFSENDGRCLDGYCNCSGESNYSDVFLDRVHLDVAEIVFVAAIYDSDNKWTFGESEMSLKLTKGTLSETFNNVFFEEDFSQGFSDCNAIEMIRFAREGDHWILDTPKIGSKKGIQELIEKYCE